jgi:hypothetical protein
MLMLIIQISLTVSAWRKGWKGWALLPMAIELTLAFIVGAAVGASGGSVEDLWGPFFLVDLLTVAALITMACRAPRKEAQAARVELAAGPAEAP